MGYIEPFYHLLLVQSPFLHQIFQDLKIIYMGVAFQGYCALQVGATILHQISQVTLEERQVQQNQEIQDVVLLPDEVLLLVLLSSQRFRCKDKESLQSSFEDNLHTQRKGFEYLDRAQGDAVRCQAPAQNVQWSAKSMALVDNIHNPVLTETMKVNAGFMNYSQPIESHHMIFRCEHPEEEVLHQLLGYKITLSILGNPIPSVVYYDIPPSYHRPLQYANVRTAESKMKLCACTMVRSNGVYLWTPAPSRSGSIWVRSNGRTCCHFSRQESCSSIAGPAICYVQDGSVWGGPLKVGFVDTQGQAFIDILHPGDVTIFLRGTLHFELNVGTEEANYISSLNSQNPGVVRVNIEASIEKCGNSFQHHPTSCKEIRFNDICQCNGTEKNIQKREKFQWMMYTDVGEFVFSDSWLNGQVGPEDKGFHEVKPNCKDLTSGALLNMVMSLSSQRNSLQEFQNLISGNFSSSVGILGHQGLPNTL
ncbi:hypothetical protein SUGI_0754570 [Cryptomeria japonica]|nr:hypothetical protein SUGI_0754570 [Cryptomeria japonica]